LLENKPEFFTSQLESSKKKALIYIKKTSHFFLRKAVYCTAIKWTLSWKPLTNSMTEINDTYLSVPEADCESCVVPEWEQIPYSSKGTYHSYEGKIEYASSCKTYF
jgi:hypothetical protein